MLGKDGPYPIMLGKDVTDVEESPIPMLDTHVMVLIMREMMSVNRGHIVPYVSKFSHAVPLRYSLTCTAFGADAGKDVFWRGGNPKLEKNQHGGLPQCLSQKNIQKEICFTCERRHRT